MSEKTKIIQTQSFVLSVNNVELSLNYFLIGIYVIRKLLHPLARIDWIVRKSILSDFWKSIWRKYGYGGVAKLDDDKIAWIIKSKSQARLTNRDIADAANVSISRVQSMFEKFILVFSVLTMLIRSRNILSLIPALLPTSRIFVRTGFMLPLSLSSISPARLSWANRSNRSVFS